MASVTRSNSRRNPQSRAFRGKLRPLASLLLACLALRAVTPAGAVPASPAGVEVVQPDGTKFRLRLRGDEFFAWHETADGYVVVKDSADGFWKYAQTATNRVAFVAIPAARVGSNDPARYGLRKYAMPDAKMLRTHIEERRRAPTGEPVELPAPTAGLGSTGATQRLTNVVEGLGSSAECGRPLPIRK